MHILFLNVSAHNLTCRIGPVCMACTNTIIVHIQSFLYWFLKIVMIQERKRDFNSSSQQTMTQPSTAQKLVNQEFLIVCK